VPGQRPPRFELPPSWETAEPEEIESWEEESEIPAAWLPDVAPERAEPAAAESPRELLERLARAAEAAAGGSRAGAGSGRGKAGEVAVDLLPATVPPQSARTESKRLLQLRERLSSPTSLREVLLLKEILGAPRARRRGPFPQ